MRSALARTDRYGRGAIALHWIIAILLIVNLALGLLHESLFDGIKGVIPLHKSLGFTILALTLARIAWRLGHRPPPHPVTMPGWERATANTVHFTFYLLMIALPLTGWLLVSGAKVLRPLNWFGLFDIPFLPVSKAVAGAARSLHEPLGLLMLALIMLHLAAALRHHLVLRDGVLARMLPGVRVRG
ncbi:cytochrome b [Sphingomonas sp. So64.6b]|uniref:cytochrome b n=1 Tax=Sphingomonas sp. So64.6b TaxID=2997354 RepID=UPI0016029635|nr:cytochrome b [Sphingomonas sp. So64.6b]QNA84955.1 cytochrome b [Sphingomonas sp. So64.6b]